ncbi:hypothetical protein D3C85_1712170 [compost metagenome]
MVVFAIVVAAVAKLSNDDSHLITLPVCPDNVNTVLFVPVQTVVLPAILPPIEFGFTVKVTSEVVAPHDPLAAIV